jgi:hypothetical protein
MRKFLTFRLQIPTFFEKCRLKLFDDTTRSGSVSILPQDLYDVGHFTSFILQGRKGDSKNLWPNVAIEWLVFLLRIREVPDSNLGPKTGYSDRRFTWFSSGPSKQMPGLCLKLLYDRLFPCPFQFIYHSTLQFEPLTSSLNKPQIKICDNGLLSLWEYYYILTYTCDWVKRYATFRS